MIKADKRKILEYLTDLFFYTAGGFIYAVAVLLFLSGNEISPGGITGIATILNYLFLLPVGTVVFILNIPLLVVGFIKFGGIFIVKTAVATLVMSLTLDISGVFLPTLKLDPVLASVFGGLLMGLGLSFFMLRGATTGGSDIVAMLINRRSPHLTVGRMMLLVDAVIVVGSAFVYRNIESALYSVIALYAQSKIMDIILYGADKGKIIYVITDKPEAMSEQIMSLVSRGITAINVTGAYTGNSKKMLMCTVRRNEVSAVCGLIRKNDPGAFVVIADAGEIYGEGFKQNS